MLFKTKLHNYNELFALRGKEDTVNSLEVVMDEAAAAPVGVAAAVEPCMLQPSLRNAVCSLQQYEVHFYTFN